MAGPRYNVGMIEGFAQMRRRIRTALARQKPLQRRIGRSINVPGLPKRPLQKGSVWAVTMVKNEADVIGHSVLHLLRQGVDGVIVADNLSTDRTPEVLRGLSAQDSRVYVGTDSMQEYYQGRKMSHLAYLAHRAGAEWVVLFDADEFWFAEGGTVADYLRSIDGAAVVRCALHDGRATSIDGIDLDDSSAQIRLEERVRMIKVAIRPDGWVWVNDGNHEAVDLPGPRADGLFGVHLPRRSLDQYTRKVTQGTQSIATANVPENFAYHWKAAAALGEDERGDQWAREVSSTDGATLHPVPIAWESWPGPQKVGKD